VIAAGGQLERVGDAVGPHGADQGRPGVGIRAPVVEPSMQGDETDGGRVVVERRDRLAALAADGDREPADHAEVGDEDPVDRAAREIAVALLADAAVGGRPHLRRRPERHDRVMEQRLELRRVRWNVHR
jgi:hypothetical protein